MQCKSCLSLPFLELEWQATLRLHKRPSIVQLRSVSLQDEDQLVNPLRLLCNCCVYSYFLLHFGDVDMGSPRRHPIHNHHQMRGRSQTSIRHHWQSSFDRTQQLLHHRLYRSTLWCQCWQKKREPGTNLSRIDMHVVRRNRSRIPKQNPGNHYWMYFSIISWFHREINFF